MTDRLMTPDVDETAQAQARQSQVLSSDDMAALLRQAREAVPGLGQREERNGAEAGPSGPAPSESAPFETTIIMDRASLNHSDRGRPDRTLRPEEFPAAPAPGEENSPARSLPPVINLRVEKTPTEFSHLYASLERQIAGVGDVTLISGETLGAERPYVLGVTSAVLGEGEDDGRAPSGDDNRAGHLQARLLD